MCNYYELVTLRHIPTGRTMYTFSHWPIENNCYYVNYDKPSHRTSVLFRIPVDECEVVDVK